MKNVFSGFLSQAFVTTSLSWDSLKSSMSYVKRYSKQTSNGRLVSGLILVPLLLVLNLVGLSLSLLILLLDCILVTLAIIFELSVRIIKTLSRYFLKTLVYIGNQTSCHPEIRVFSTSQSKPPKER